MKYFIEQFSALHFFSQYPPSCQLLIGNPPCFSTFKLRFNNSLWEMEHNNLLRIKGDDNQ